MQTDTVHAILWLFREVCAGHLPEKAPVQEEIAPNHFVSCHRATELSLRGVARSTAAGTGT
jgi:hypothetical protein